MTVQIHALLSGSVNENDDFTGVCLYREKKVVFSFHICITVE